MLLDKSKVFVWSDKAVLLLLEMYREREEDFSIGLKRSNKIWTEIAAEMKEANSSYEVIGQQCASKMSGLKRTYKNIAVMDSIFGDKALINPPAIATSDGPVNPCKELSPTSSTISCSDVRSKYLKTTAAKIKS
ncbi:hypothetical protein ALC60_10246 [Trachymyrmex zeteki]|uniref:Myb/SANT-like DNA-binding domain-containing protein n=1 Tax=Mycetomoellerius zeteki TaxID=64791 RepID=A0A151WS99_9HYME|nr:hypothetical protein ALC60_10246 [Trachymyrmex zeteki]